MLRTNEHVPCNYPTVSTVPVLLGFRFLSLYVIGASDVSVAVRHVDVWVHQCTAAV